MLTRLRALIHHANHRLMSSAPTSGTQRVVNANPACCSIPPVQSDYTPKGVYKPYAGFDRVYVTGPQSSDMAIVSTFDIFGFYPQTQQGADKLAVSLNAAVYMPDFFEGSAPFPLSKFPPQTDADKNALQAFFAGPAQPEKNIKALVRVGTALRADPDVKRIGAYGLCWGGKLAILAGCGESPVFDAVSAIHPAMLSASDADNLSVPLGLFITKDEPKEEYDSMIRKLSSKSFADKVAYKYYPNMFHGFAAARADLKKEDNLKEFEDVYSKLRGFFANAFERDRGGTQTRL
ncbi:hypothetical protein EW145_g3599 [Phellinidium pouzarii]|uniref:Dienelactone hydrolase domain-containing protein n=1 Tax=Phellinidium pouzarii TaxID=167371 RepID=A0A4S4L719_9AGAM|nr:hypothetical protein EW145_g3599 [Phellinidium pouzarii]